MTAMYPVLSTLRFIAVHPLSSRQRLRSFWRYGRWQVESRIRREIEFNWIGGTKLIARSGMTGATGNIYCGLHEFADMAFLMHLLQPDDLFVDVGANIGSYTILASGVCGARSIAIEPDPETINALRRNIEANCLNDRVELAECALGATSGMAKFTIGLDTINHVVSEDTKGRSVKMQRLDDMVGDRNPLFIKMDVEGYESEVIDGARKTLEKRSLVALQIETIEDAVMDILGDLGFSRWSYDPFERRLRCYSGDDLPSASANALYLRDIDKCRTRIEGAARRNVLGQEI